MNLFQFKLALVLMLTMVSAFCGALVETTNPGTLPDPFFFVNSVSAQEPAWR
ncbi:MAG: hypothetical protein KDD66_07570 [Bdellovibrionales bacterium]|nr:hypothetical protein [Bdellovibrionales bacterium]